MQKRNLTDDDVQAIVDLLRKDIEASFHRNLGRGVWSLAWKAFVGLCFGLAAYGAFKKEW